MFCREENEFSMKVDQAVILVAGKGTRMWPLTLTRPKPLVKIANKSLLEIKLNALTSLVKEVILVVGYKGEMVKKIIGKKYKNLRIKYVWQRKQKGTAHALMETEKLLKERFLLLYGDDIHTKEDIERCLKKFPCIAAIQVKNPSLYGVIVAERNLVKDIIEKPKKFIGDLVNPGILYLPKSILKEKIEESERKEYEVPDFLRKFAKKEKLYFVKIKEWLPVSYPWHLLGANEFFLKKIKRKIEGKIEKGCHILGPVFVKEGTEIKSGTYIEGPVLIGKNCQIGPNCYIRKFTTIGDNCRIGQAVEIKNSIIGDGSKISHLSYVGDSIIGENCNLGAGTIVANLRFDEKTIKTKVKGKLQDTERKKFGCVLGDNVKTGIHVSLMPGVMIGANSIVYPHTIVFKNIKENTIFKGSKRFS